MPEIQIKVLLQIKMQECPHCHKIIGNAVIRVGATVHDLMLVDSAEVECPRPECGKLIGHLDLIPLFPPVEDPDV